MFETALAVFLASLRSPATAAGEARSGEQALPAPRRSRFPLPLVLLGAVGGMLALAGAAVLFRKGR